MSDWRELQTDWYLQGKTDCWLELWGFNGQKEPKFWFGEEVMWGDQKAIVLGLEWRPEDMPLPVSSGVLRAGWWYAVKRSRKESTVRVHEDSLEEIPDKCPISDT